MTRDLCGAEAERLPKADLLRRDRQPALQDQACGQRQVEKHMRKDDALQAVNLYRGQAKGYEGLRQHPVSSEHREDTDDRDQHRQQKWCAQQGDREAPQRKASSHQSARQWDRQTDGDQRR